MLPPIGQKLDRPFVTQTRDSFVRAVPEVAESEDLKKTLLVCVLAGTVVPACSRGAEREGPAIAVATSAARLGTITAVFETVGTVAPAPDAQQLVTVPEPARIVELPRSEGEPVMRGDVLVRFEVAAMQSAAAQQVADVSGAQARLANAQAAHARSKELFDRGLVPRLQVEELQAQIAAAEADLRAANTASSVFEAGVSARTVVRALFDGVVQQRLMTTGELAQPASVIMIVIDPQRLELTASMPFADAERIAIGNPARTTPLPDGTPAMTLRVAARPDSVTNRETPVVVRMAFDSPPPMAIGTAIQVAIDGETHEGAVLVPLAALSYEGDEASVFVMNNGKAERRLVAVGISNAEDAEITEGLQAQEVVIIDSQLPLVDGAKVAPQ
jgi:cobalt-zinc-cadmium efflux system membrane fusion protein